RSAVVAPERLAVVGIAGSRRRQLVVWRGRRGCCGSARSSREGRGFARPDVRARGCAAEDRNLGHTPGDARGHAPPEGRFRPRPCAQPWKVCGVSERPLPDPPRIAGNSFTTLSDDDLATCVHCGLCLDACPTFRVTGLEIESPRGRIYLMTQWKRGGLPFTNEQARHIDLCLGCHTCEAVCPSGVPYGRIIEAGRSEVERMRRPTPKHTLAKTALRQIVAHPGRLRAFGALTRVAQKVGLTSVIRSGRQLPPLRAAYTPPAGGIAPAIGPPRHRVAFLVGCVMPILYPQSHEAAVKLLQLAGCEVWFPKAERCCGALHAHNGDLEEAERLREHNTRVYAGGEFDALVVDSAGCGS